MKKKKFRRLPFAIAIAIATLAPAALRCWHNNDYSDSDGNGDAAHAKCFATRKQVDAAFGANPRRGPDAFFEHFSHCHSFIRLVPRVQQHNNNNTSRKEHKATITTTTITTRDNK